MSIKRVQDVPNIQKLRYEGRTELDIMKTILNVLKKNPKNKDPVKGFRALKLALPELTVTEIINHLNKLA